MLSYVCHKKFQKVKKKNEIKSYNENILLGLTFLNETLYFYLM